MTTTAYDAHTNRKSPEDYPYVMRLPGQRAIALTIPADWVQLDKTGEMCLRPPAVRWLDKLRALYSRINTEPTPGFIRVLREAMNLTQEELGRRVGVNKMTVSRWERGAIKPGVQALKSIGKLRNIALRRGLLLEPG
jgi:DNA-binding XRE family transcriptional regulator